MLSEKNCGRLLALVQDDNIMIISKLAMEFHLSSFTFWKILRKKLHLYPHKPKTLGPAPDLRAQDD